MHGQGTAQAAQELASHLDRKTVRHEVVPHQIGVRRARPVVHAHSTQARRHPALQPLSPITGSTPALREESPRFSPSRQFGPHTALGSPSSSAPSIR